VVLAAGRAGRVAVVGSKSIALKARQIGITWLAAGYGLWLLLYRAGVEGFAVSINEAEAIKVVNRVWDMYLSLARASCGAVKVGHEAGGGAGRRSRSSCSTRTGGSAR
jgi:hypothetical protein